MRRREEESGWNRVSRQVSLRSEVGVRETDFRLLILIIRWMYGYLLPMICKYRLLPICPHDNVRSKDKWFYHDYLHIICDYRSKSKGKIKNGCRSSTTIVCIYLFFCASLSFKLCSSLSSPAFLYISCLTPRITCISFLGFIHPDLFSIFTHGLRLII